jgi:FixJ family two-component response regulator
MVILTDRAAATDYQWENFLPIEQMSRNKGKGMGDKAISESPKVFMVDDDERIRNSFQFLADSIGLEFEAFASAKDFLEACNPYQPGCLVLDVRMPQMSGLDLQERLIELEIRLPIIFVSGHADIRMASRAFRMGAFDFVEKPVNNQELLDRIQQAIEQDAKWRRERESRSPEVESCINKLTSREREVLHLITVGKAIKQIATIFDISPQTAAKHHARVLDKMGVDTPVELVNLLNARHPLAH